MKPSQGFWVTTIFCFFFRSGELSLKQMNNKIFQAWNLWKKKGALEIQEIDEWRLKNGGQTGNRRFSFKITGIFVFPFVKFHGQYLWGIQLAVMLQWFLVSVTAVMMVTSCYTTGSWGNFGWFLSKVAKWTFTSCFPDSSLLTSVASFHKYSRFCHWFLEFGSSQRWMRIRWLKDGFWRMSRSVSWG